ncbi:hypothetical protein L9F63_023039, partial [Diploptera punctata]
NVKHSSINHKCVRLYIAINILQLHTCSFLSTSCCLEFSLFCLNVELKVKSSERAASSSPVIKRSLKEALYDTLNGILSPHQNVRIAAEQRIQALEV